MNETTLSEQIFSGKGFVKKKARKTADEEHPEVYLKFVRNITTYLGVGSCLGTLLFVSNWNTPGWNGPWALGTWIWFILFNLVWTQTLPQKGKKLVYLEYLRVSINQLHLIALFYLTGGSQENFWLPTLICTMGASTTLFLVTGKMAILLPLNHLLVYILIYGIDCGFAYMAMLDLIPIILVSACLISSLYQISNVLLEQFFKISKANEQSLQADFDRQKAESANQAKTMFLANMNHEIRTPLISIAGFAEILLGKELSDKDRRHYLRIIKRNTDHLQMLISDILSFSKIESGELSVDMEKLVLRDQLTTVEDLLLPMAKEKGLDLKIEFCENLPEVIYTDPTKFKQILINLVSNAIKYTETGGVTLKIERSRQSLVNPDEIKLYFEVHDTGCGIPEEHHQSILEKFVQLNSNISTPLKGAGLGLPISRQLAQVLGGDLKLLKSSLGKGSVFQFSLTTIFEKDEPSASKESTKDSPVLPSHQNKATSLAGMKVLVVDDSPDTLHLMKVLLETADIQVTKANNGKEALEKMDEERFDTVLMDLEMPVMTGYDAMKSLRKSGNPTPVIAFTANAVEEVIDLTKELGFVECQTKPISHQKLLNLMTKYRQ